MNARGWLSRFLPGHAARRAEFDRTFGFEAKTAQDQLHHEAESTSGLKGAIVGEVRPKTDVPAYTAARVYQIVPSVYSCVKKKSSMAASAPIKLYKRNTRSGATEEVTTGVIATAWANPNPFLTNSRMIWEWVAWRELTGRGYLRLEQDASTGKYFFSVLESTNVHVVTDPETKVKVYIYEINGKRQYIPFGEIAELNEFNPLDYWFGLTPLSPISRDVETERNVKKWLQAQFERGNMKGGMIQSEKKIDDQEILKLKAEWRNRKANSSRVMFLPKEMTFTPFTEGGQEAPLKDVLGESFDVVALAFGLHPVLFGRSTGVKPESLDVIETWVWNSEILPLLTYACEVLNQRFSWIAGSNFFFRADVSQIPALRRDDMDCTRVGVAQSSVGKRTINEWRAMDGEAPLSDEVHGPGAAEFGRMPIPVWEYMMQAKMAHLQAQLAAAFAPVKNPDGTTSPGPGLSASDQVSPALPTPGSEGGRRDQSQNGEPQMIDQTGKRSFDQLIGELTDRKASILAKMDALKEFLADDDEEKD
jgi:HK97 family phage portal protein